MREAEALRRAEHALLRDGAFCNNPLIRKRIEALLADPILAEHMPAMVLIFQRDLEFLNANPHSVLKRWRYNRLCSVERLVSCVKNTGSMPKKISRPKRPFAPHPRLVRPAWMTDPEKHLPKKPPTKREPTT